MAMEHDIDIASASLAHVGRNVLDMNLSLSYVTSLEVHTEHFTLF